MTHKEEWLPQTGKKKSHNGQPCQGSWENLSITDILLLGREQNMWAFDIKFNLFEYFYQIALSDHKSNNNADIK